MRDKRLNTLKKNKYNLEVGKHGIVHKHDPLLDRRIKTMIDILDLSYLTDSKRILNTLWMTRGHITEYMVDIVRQVKCIKDDPDRIRIGIVSGDLETILPKLLKDITLLKNNGFWISDVEKYMLEEQALRKKQFELLKTLPPEQQAEVRSKMLEEFNKEIDIFLGNYPPELLKKKEV